jgi:hypothetical protein
LAEQLPASKLFSREIVGTSTTYFLIRDILKARGHDVSEISTRTIRSGIASYFYENTYSDTISEDHELALATIQVFDAQKRPTGPHNGEFTAE